MLFLFTTAICFSLTTDDKPMDQALRPNFVIRKDLEANRGSKLPNPGFEPILIQEKNSVEQVKEKPLKNSSEATDLIKILQNRSTKTVYANKWKKGEPKKLKKRNQYFLPIEANFAVFSSGNCDGTKWASGSRNAIFVFDKNGNFQAAIPSKNLHSIFWSKSHPNLIALSTSTGSIENPGKMSVEIWCIENNRTDRVLKKEATSATVIWSDTNNMVYCNDTLHIVDITKNTTVSLPNSETTCHYFHGEFSPSNRFLATGESQSYFGLPDHVTNQHVRIWDLKTNKLHSEFMDFEIFRWSKEKEKDRIALFNKLSTENKVAIRNLQTDKNEFVHEFKSEGSYLYEPAARFSPYLRFFSKQTDQQSLYLYDTEQKKQSFLLSAPKAKKASPSILGDSITLACNWKQSVNDKTKWTFRLRTRDHKIYRWQIVENVVQMPPKTETQTKPPSLQFGNDLEAYTIIPMKFFDNRETSGPIGSFIFRRNQLTKSQLTSKNFLSESNIASPVFSENGKLESSFYSSSRLREKWKKEDPNRLEEYRLDQVFHTDRYSLHMATPYGFNANPFQRKILHVFDLVADRSLEVPIYPTTKQKPFFSPDGRLLFIGGWFEFPTNLALQPQVTTFSEGTIVVDLKAWKYQVFKDMTFLVDRNLNVYGRKEISTPKSQHSLMKIFQYRLGKDEVLENWKTIPTKGMTVGRLIKANEKVIAVMWNEKEKLVLAELLNGKINILDSSAAKVFRSYSHNKLFYYQDNKIYNSKNDKVVITLPEQRPSRQRFPAKERSATYSKIGNSEFTSAKLHSTTVGKILDQNKSIHWHPSANAFLFESYNGLQMTDLNTMKTRKLNGKTDCSFCPISNSWLINNKDKQTIKRYSLNGNLLGSPILDWNHHTQEIKVTSLLSPKEFVGEGTNRLVIITEKEHRRIVKPSSTKKVKTN